MAHTAPRFRTALAAVSLVALTVLVAHEAKAEDGATQNIVVAQNTAPSTSSGQTDFYIPPPRGTPNGRMSGGTRGLHGPTPAAGSTPPSTTSTTGTPKAKPTTGAGSTNP